MLSAGGSGFGFDAAGRLGTAFFGKWAALFCLLAALPGAGLALENSAVSLDELRDVQRQVQSVMKLAGDAVVAVEAKGSTASGVIISADGLVLTAAHVTSVPGRKIHARLPDGREVPCVTLGLDEATDAAMMKLEGDEEWPHVPLCRDLRTLAEGTWCFALGHPGGFDPKRGAVLRVGRVLKQSANGLQTDCVLMGGDSGGPLFNLNGEVIGIHSQIWEARDQNMHVSVAPFLRSWDAMQKSQVVRKWATGSGGWLGVATQISDSGHLQLAEVAPDSPAAQAGLKSGDIIVAMDGVRMLDQPQFSSAISALPAGQTISLRVRNAAGRERVVEVELGTRKEAGR